MMKTLVRHRRCMQPARLDLDARPLPDRGLQQALDAGMRERFAAGHDEQ
jgi:hypothetical protein